MMPYEGMKKGGITVASTGFGCTKSGVTALASIAIGCTDPITLVKGHP